MKTKYIVFHMFFALFWVIMLFRLASCYGYAFMHMSEVRIVYVKEVQEKQCTSDQAIQWWTGKTDLKAVRAQMCSNYYAKR